MQAIKAIASSKVVKRIFVLCMVVCGVLALPPATAAQGPTPEEAVMAQLVSNGYDVVSVGFFPDDQGNPRNDMVYAQLETITTDLSDRYVVNQVLRGFDALAQFYPRVDYYTMVLHYDRWLYLFVTTGPDFDDLKQKRVQALDYYNSVRRQVRIYDTVEKRYISEKDFTSQSQTNKNQTNKDFTGQAKNPLPPTNTNPEAKAENILLEPATTYLPADAATQAHVLATLTDQSYSGLPGRGVNFTFEVRGQEERNLGTAQTDRFGTARAQVSSSRPLDLVLLRAGTSTLNATVPMFVGPAPGTDRKAQADAVVKGLASQGYKDAEAEYVQVTGPTGRAFKLGIAVVRVESKSFDREVYSQLSRMMGTLRTVIPDANLLRPVLVYAAPDGHEYAILFSVNADVWDAYVRGDIGENEFWQTVNYDGAIDENGRSNDQKDFLSKNFTGTQAQNYSRAPRTVDSTLSQESWGDQLTVGSFVIAIGGRATDFNVEELSGSATGFALYATPEYNDPVFTFGAGDSPDAFRQLQLEAGQYMVEVRGSSPPARVTLSYVEHLAR
jgi:hypothetical protein